MICFFSKTMHIHIWVLWCNMLFMVYNCLGQQEPQISHQLITHGSWWSRNLLFLQNLPQPLPNCKNGFKMLGTIYLRMTFGSFMTICMWEYMPALPPEGDTLCIDVTFWAPLTECDMYISFGLNLLSYIPTTINYLSHQFSKQWTCPRVFFFFSGSVCTYNQCPGLYLH